MRFAQFALASAALLALTPPAAAAEGPVFAPPAVSALPKSTPFVEFASSNLPRAASRAEEQKPRYEITIGAPPPPSPFAHMRLRSSNALLECVIPSSLRRND